MTTQGAPTKTQNKCLKVFAVVKLKPCTYFRKKNWKVMHHDVDTIWDVAANLCLPTQTQQYSLYT